MSAKTILYSEPRPRTKLIGALNKILIPKLVLGSRERLQEIIRLRHGVSLPSCKLVRVAVKERKLTYYNEETPLFTQDMETVVALDDSKSLFRLHEPQTERGNQRCRRRTYGAHTPL